MSYTIEPIDVANRPKEKVVDSRPDHKKKSPDGPFKWWLADNDKDLAAQVLSTTEYLRKSPHNVSRVRQASIFARLFSGKPLYNYLASNSTLDSSNQLPIGRPTANVVYSCTDTLVSRISQDRPNPTFLTDGGHYKERKQAEQLNQFIQGEFYRTKAYDKGALTLRDSCLFGNGLDKVFSQSGKVCIERTIETELLTDFNDAYYGNPRQLIQRKLVDRGVLMELCPNKEEIIMGATHGDVDTTPRSTETVSDQIILAEAWHLPSGKDSGDGRHVLVCSNGVVDDDPDWDKETFPFAKLPYNPNPVGWFAQGLAEILMPTQMEIYRMLIVASQNIELMGVPRVLIDELSKILETAFNNRTGSIIKYRGNPPQFVNALGNSPEILPWIIWLIQNAFQMSGISAMSAASQKPAGLNSGEAIRSFDDLQTDRFAALSRRYQNFYTDLSYLVIDCAKDIAKEEGSYTTVYPGKDGTRSIDFKGNLIKDVYVIQCFEESSLPKDPAGRQARLSEMLAAGEITNAEFRRLSGFPDLKQSDQLANALEERILYMLDKIVDEGKEGYEPPDAFILDPTDMASTLCVNYINLYSTTQLEDDKLDLLREWYTQVQTEKSQAQPPQIPNAPGAPGAAPLPVAPPNPSVSPVSGAQV
jgi:hypothetical protein